MFILRLLPPIIILSASILLNGCSRTPHINHPIFRWESVGPTADSLICVLDSSYIMADYERFSEALTRLATADSIMRNAPATFYYWRLRDAQRRHLSDSAQFWLSRALKHADASKRPYERNRIRMFQAIMAPNQLKTYQHLDTALSWFKANADSFMTADCYTHISNMFNDLGDFTTSLRYIRRVIDIYHSLGVKPYAYKNELNYATQLEGIGDSANARLSIARLVRDPYTRTDTYFYTLVMESGWQMLGVDSILNRYYQLACMPTNTPSFCRNANYFMSKHALSDGNLDSAIIYSNRAVASQRRCAKRAVTADVWEWHARLMNKTGQLDSAWKYVSLASELKDSLYQADARHKIASMHAKSEIEQMKLTREWSARRAKLMFLLILALVACASAILIGLLHRRNSSLKLSSAQSQLDLERNRRILGHAILSIEEKNKVIARLNELARNNLLNADSLHRLRSNEKRLDGEFDHLQMLYDSVSSLLIVRLKEKAPSISPAMQQLAVLIVCGLNTKEIAAIMNIAAESVKKARYRMRKLLEVPHDENLTDLLKRMAAE